MFNTNKNRFSGSRKKSYLDSMKKAGLSGFLDPIWLLSVQDRIV